MYHCLLRCPNGASAERGESLALRTLEEVGILCDEARPLMINVTPNCLHVTAGVAPLLRRVDRIEFEAAAVAVLGQRDLDVRMKHCLDAALEFKHRLIRQVTVPVKPDTVIGDRLHDRNAAKAEMSQSSNEFIEVREIPMISLALQGGYCRNSEIDATLEVGLHECVNVNGVWLGIGDGEDAIRVECIAFHLESVAA
jgi:hypothetical protein